MTIDEMIYEMEQAFHASNRDETEACDLIADKLRSMEAKLKAADELAGAIARSPTGAIYYMPLMAFYDAGKE